MSTKVNVCVGGRELTVYVFEKWAKVIGQRKCVACKGKGEHILDVSVTEIGAEDCGPIDEAFRTKVTKLMKRIFCHKAVFCDKDSCFDEVRGKRDSLAKDNKAEIGLTPN